MDEAPIAALWTLTGTSARGSTGGLAAEIDVARLGAGLGKLSVGGQSLAGRLMAIEVAAEQPAATESAWQPADVFVRGTDLVAAYQEPFGLRFNLQVYWRWLPPMNGSSAILEAIMSLHTRQWEAYPQVTASTALPAAEIVPAPEAVIYRLAGDVSYIETALAGDFCPEISSSQSDGLRAAAWRYGKNFMERGVIRRLRLRGAFVPRRDDLAAARLLSQTLAAEQPPLTA